MATERIGRYEILRHLGEGGMGKVWVARDPDLDREVVIKGLHEHLAATPEARERLLREARSLGKLDHPNIVQVYDLIEKDGHWYICMQQVEGENLRERLKRGPLTYTEVHRLAQGIAAALTAAHRHDIIHRDVKAENVMVTPEGNAKLLDFGIAHVPSDKNLTQADASPGTILAMAPEQLTGAPADRRSDLFCLGVLVYEMSTGQHPYPGEQFAEIAYNILHESPAQPTDHRQDLPGELVHVISKCLEKKPEFRYQDADDLHADLRRLGRELDGGKPDVIVATGKAGALDKFKRFTSDSLLRAVPDTVRHPGWPLLAMIVILGLFAAYAMWFWHPEPYRPLANLKIGITEAERASHNFLTARGVSLYGYKTHTEAWRARDLQRFESFQRLSTDDRLRLEGWRPVVLYRTTFASADHQDRFQLDHHPDGCLLRFEHILRADYNPINVADDSAAAIAHEFLAEALALDPDLLEALPMTESLTGGRRVREFRWKLNDALPGGAVGTVFISLVGGELKYARVGVDFPPVVKRSIDDAEDHAETAGMIAFMLVGLAAVVAAIRNGWYIFPSLRFLIVFTIIHIVYFQASEWNSTMRSMMAGGFAEVFPNMIASILLVSPVTGALLWGAWGFIIATIGANQPQLLPGHRGLLRCRVDRRTLATSVAVGLLAGTVIAGVRQFAPPTLAGAGLFAWSPVVDNTQFFNPFILLVLVVTEATFFATFFGLGLAVMAYAARRLKLGWWAWLLGAIVWAAMLLSPEDFSFQPSYPEFILHFAMIALWLLIIVRYGLLAGAFVGLAARLLQVVHQMAGASLASLNTWAAIYLILWLAAVVWALWALRRPTAPTKA